MGLNCKLQLCAAVVLLALTAEVTATLGAIGKTAVAIGVGAKTLSSVLKYSKGSGGTGKSAAKGATGAIKSAVKGLSGTGKLAAKNTNRARKLAGKGAGDRSQPAGKGAGGASNSASKVQNKQYTLTSMKDATEAASQGGQGKPEQHSQGPAGSGPHHNTDKMREGEL